MKVNSTIKKKNEIKILQITEDFYPFSLGGIGIVAYNLVHELTKRKAIVGVFTLLRNKKTSFIINEKLPFKVYTSRITFTIGRFRVSLGSLPKLVKIIKNYEIIHLHSHLFFLSIVGLIISKIFSKKVVITCHGAYSQSFPPLVSKIWLKTIGRLVYNLSDLIIALSRKDFSILVHKCKTPPHKIVIIPNWVDTNKFNPQKFDKDTSKTRVLFVGRLVRGKGVENLLKAFIETLEKFNDIELVIVGSGPFELKLKEMLKMLPSEIRSKITHKKNLPEEGLLHEYNSSTLFILPSFVEGMPLTVIEAMSCGKPIIITEYLKKVFGDIGGYYVDPKSPEKISNAIINILSNKKKLIKTGKLNRKIAVARFSEKRCVQKIFNEYKGIK